MSAHMLSDIFCIIGGIGGAPGPIGPGMGPPMGPPMPGPKNLPIMWGPPCKIQSTCAVW